MSVVLVGSGVSREGPEDLEDRFPGSWNPRRAMRAESRPLVDAVSRAVHDAGWWEPGLGGGLSGGLVVGTDLQSFEAASRYGRALAGSGASASDFLFALPSTVTATVGLALGLKEYQATVTMHGLSGFRAVAHAIDLLRLGRLRRVVAGALTVVGPAVIRALQRIDGRFAGAQPFQLAVALCLESGDNIGVPIATDFEEDGVEVFDACEALNDVFEEYRHLAAPSLLGVLRHLERDCTVAHRDSCLRETDRIRLGR